MGLNLKGCVMELVGTFALCFVGGLAVQARADAAIEAVALAHGFVLAFMIYAGANISGAHYNPAVSLALACVGKCKWLDALCFMGFQLIGAIIAGVLVAVIYDKKTLELIGWKKLSYCGCPHGIGFSTNKAGESPPIQMTLQGAGIEAMATFFLMLVIMGTAVDHRKAKAVYGIAIGLTLAMCIYANAQATGAALNPWRSFGPIIGAGLLNSSEFEYLGPS
jgi:glycerol uptake facilitator-like aquaporin